MKTLAIIASGVLLLVGATGAQARGGAKKPTGPAEVTATGCVHKGAQPYCWSLKTAEGVEYSFGGYPAVDGQCYAVTGTPTLGLCRQGTQLGVTKLEKQNQNCCEPPPAPAPTAQP